MTIFNVPSPERLGKLITKLREEAGWSQRELARRSGVNFATIQKLENADTKSPGLEVLLNISKALDVNIMHFIKAYDGREPINIKTHSYDDVFKKAFIEAFKGLTVQERADLLGIDAELLETNLSKLKKQRHEQ